MHPVFSVETVGLKRTWLSSESGKMLVSSFTNAEMRSAFRDFCEAKCTEVVTVEIDPRMFTGIDIDTEQLPKVLAATSCSGTFPRGSTCISRLRNSFASSGNCTVSSSSPHTYTITASFTDTAWSISSSCSAACRSSSFWNLVNDNFTWSGRSRQRVASLCPMSDKPILASWISCLLRSFSSRISPRVFINLLTSASFWLGPKKHSGTGGVIGISASGSWYSRLQSRISSCSPPWSVTTCDTTTPSAHPPRCSFVSCTVISGATPARILLGSSPSTSQRSSQLILRSWFAKSDAPVFSMVASTNEMPLSVCAIHFFPTALAAASFANSTRPPSIGYQAHRMESASATLPGSKGFANTKTESSSL
mmetsp:Transcript_24431/g.61410  ORF Transcript_24431/g.61410 Transcript_24431/m.61410 type:complete len:364 (+) Transcript_24431:715-1806(+)